MQIHAPTFFVIVGTLAAGGAAGYFASEKNVLGTRAEPPRGEGSAAPSAVAAPARSAPAARPSEIPACGDDVGSPGACPPPGYPAEEGGCGMAPVKRCNDYKKAFKPKVAENAVACLNALKPTERCDPMRLHLCGHLALMNACTDPREADGSDTVASPGTALATCEIILRGCAGAPLGPKMQECRATLAGMNDVGRSAMVACMKTHCSDRGLLDCEAMLE